jgi:hypothetical protein
MESSRDTGFRPEPDGFGVPNAGLTRLGLETSWTSFEKAFDDLTGMRGLIARRLIYPLVYAGRFDGRTGHCHGMASVSLLAFLDRLGTDWRAWEPGVSTLYDISSLENAMSRFGDRERGIDVYQAAQLSMAQVGRFLQASRRPPNVRDAFQEIENAFSHRQPIVLSLVRKIEGDWKDYLGSPMHSLLAYRYEAIGGGEVKVWVYEPNRPGLERDVVLDLQANRFSYQDKPGEKVYSGENGYRMTTTTASVLTHPNVRRLVTIRRGIKVVSAHADLTVGRFSGRIVKKLGSLMANRAS